jgi:DMSO/TMAO reductase YedYZ heme-binding membrane subunit/uncharacterized protein with FMN-binding domain
MISIILTILLYFLTTALKPMLKKQGTLVFTLSSILALLSYLFLSPTSIINEGFLGLSFYILVMFASVLPKHTMVYKNLMSLRRENSILGFILLIPHATIYLVSTFGYYEWYGVISFLVMIPLFITSFYKFRKRMTGTSWKKLHKLSYLAYLLTYIHLMVIGEQGHLIPYTIVFMSYFALKAYNGWLKNYEPIKKISIVSLGTVIAVTLVYVSFFNPIEIVFANSNEPIELAEVTSDEEVVSSNDMSTSETTSQQYNDGVYNGSARGFKNLTVEIDVTLENDVITDINVISTGSTKPAKGVDFIAALYEMIDKVLVEQTTDIDTISGATKTTKGFLDAMDEALDQAKN